MWNFGVAHSHGISSPSYTLHVSNPVRRVSWRPGYETELAVAYYTDSTFNPALKTPQPVTLSLSPSIKQLSLENENTTVSGTLDSEEGGASPSIGVLPMGLHISGGQPNARSGELVEIWDVRRPWLAKWTVNGSNNEGGVSGMVFSSFDTSMPLCTAFVR